MRILFALPGFHRVHRGAEVALISVARELARQGDEVTLVGSGAAVPGEPYEFVHAGSIPRTAFERMPSLPGFRDECAFEELSFIPGLLAKFDPARFDVTMTCSYPFTNWVLRRPIFGGRRPAHVFVTENGDWPAFARNAEYRFFGCDGLVCTNPDFYERNKDRWRCALIPNGVDIERFRPGAALREKYDLPNDRPIVLMVSALISTKRVDLGIRAVGQLPDAYLIVAGDGPMRDEIDRLAAKYLPGRFRRLTVRSEQMPDLYRAADMFLHLSPEEAFGNVYLEAMACGLPVAAPDSGRVRWILGEDQYLFDSSEPAVIARRIGEALNAPAAKREAFTARAAGFAWSNIATQYRQFLDTVLVARDAKS